MTGSFPYDYSNSSVGNFSIAIYRYKRASGSPRQMWLVAGGPGEVRSPSCGVLNRIF
jgi:hypothetical protein